MVITMTDTAKRPFLRHFISALITAIIIALVYWAFEAAVHWSTQYVWNDLLATDVQRLLVIPLAMGLAVLYFFVQHHLDPQQEHTEQHGLATNVKPTLQKVGIVLLVGFLSLFAGASLGPEAILVPASAMLGALIGGRVTGAKQGDMQYASALGLVALLAVFFNSFFTGMLGLLLVHKMFKLKVTADFVVLAAVASVVSVWVLRLVSGEGHTASVQSEWFVDAKGLIWLVAMAAVGYGITYLLKLFTWISEPITDQLWQKAWWYRGLIAGAILGVLYIAGGTLIQFTGNQAISPLLEGAAAIGIGGLLWIAFLKLAVMAWSKAVGYRGGMIFPLVLALTAIVAIAHLYTDSFGVTIGIVAGIAGALVAERRAKVLL